MIGDWPSCRLPFRLLDGHSTVYFAFLSMQSLFPDYIKCEWNTWTKRFWAFSCEKRSEANSVACLFLYLHILHYWCNLEAQFWRLQEERASAYIFVSDQRFDTVVTGVSTVVSRLSFRSRWVPWPLISSVFMIIAGRLSLTFWHDIMPDWIGLSETRKQKWRRFCFAFWHRLLCLPKS